MIVKPFLTLKSSSWEWLPVLTRQPKEWSPPLSPRVTLLKNRWLKKEKQQREVEEQPQVSRTSQFQIGQMLETPDGKAYQVIVDKIQGLVDTLKLTLIDKSTMLHLEQVIKTGNKTHESHQKFGLPFAFPSKDISAEFSHSAGKLTIFLLKPQVIGDDQEHVVTTFIIPANSATQESKVAIKPEQRNDCILFKCVSSKYDTEVKVIISGKKLAFHNSHSFDDKDETGEAVVRTIKSTQTFTLPWSVSMDLITIIPAGNDGHQVKVMKPASVQVSETPINIYIKPLP